MNNFCNTIAFICFALLQVAGNQTLAMEDVNDNQDERIEETYEAALFELINNFDCYADVFDALEIQLSSSTPDPQTSRSSKKVIEPNALLMNQWLSYFRLIAKSLDEFENGIFHWNSEPRPSKTSVRFRNAKDLHRLVRKSLFDCNDDSELSHIEINFIEKYEFFLFVKSAIRGDFINTIYRKTKNKRDVPVINLFVSLLEETNLDATDFAFIHLEKIYRRFALAQFDDRQELVSKIEKTYPKLRVIKKIKTANMKNAEEDKCQECGICLEKMLCLSHEDFCSHKGELSEPGFFCHDCLTEYLRINIEEQARGNFFDLDKICCPEKKCTQIFDSPRLWQNLLLSGVLDREDVKKILTWRINTLSLSVANSLIKCSSSNCSNLLYVNDQTILECVQCLSATCRLCKGKYASDCCNQIIVPEGADMNQCPICHTWAERSEGCDFINCVGCGSKFDIKSGKLWTKEYASEEKDGSHSNGAMSQNDIDKIQKKLAKKEKKRNSRTFELSKK